MRVEIRNDSVFIHGYVNAVERLSKPIRETLHGRVKTFLERIKAGVFRNALKKNDNVLVLLNHDDNRVLASTKDGSAVLEEDNIGLRAEITITDEEVVKKARDGKLSGWSFGFIANDDVITNEGKDEIRTVTDLDLLEVSILDDTKAPAYYGTSIETREGGARMKEIRAESFGETEEGKPISIDELVNIVNELVGKVEGMAELVAAKVIEALKTEQKAEETEEETEVTEGTESETQEETEETEETEEQTEEKADTEETEGEENEETEAETEEETEDQENRSIDYSAFEARLAKLTK